MTRGRDPGTIESVRARWQLVAGLVGFVLVGTISGCGLLLDVDPPDPEPDAGGGMDAGAIDGGARDAGEPDAGPCRTDVDCSDDDACTGIERCEDGVCIDGEEVVCPDDDVCDGSLACDPDTGECSVVIEPPTCVDDDDPCNGAESCDPVAGCIATPAPDCDDGIACTIDRCTVLGCEHEPDSTACTASAGGVCIFGEGCEYPVCVLGVTCVPENPCQEVSCAGDDCVRSVRACGAEEVCCGGSCVAAGCDDRDPCTVDRCEPATGCVHTGTTGSSCDDGNPCTVADRCEAGRCVAGVPRCVEPDPCRRALCDPSSGQCSTAPVMDGAPCSDGDACSIGDACTAGSCRRGLGTPTCDDGQPCTDDQCDSNTGCRNDPVSDGTACGTFGGTGICAGGRCLAATACVLGTEDCDGDGDCECVGTCGLGPIRRCIASVDVCSAPCRAIDFCCGISSSRDYGRCIAPGEVCLGGTCCADLGGSAM